ncbi:DUF2058 domain-containing protein [Pseudohaliea rubra]|uniref:Nucleoprotein/polynucleotide-associated enzyme n=1 Tax=Pseudohaliea rubra DSM 19751 TaxID=1265313 RepID=A0A095VTE9_9GAMM|nr:DUF2058 domain-containing protein [Pseudohaliea rubra]KGE04625.1 nucleoprotein/polynucleotide-associated enzyme [Pseudohaliea rubra DSM 19751]
MAGSLQDQLLNAGLSDPKKARKLEKEKRKQQRAAKKARNEPVDEIKEAAQRAREEKAARDRVLNEARNEAARRKAIDAQIADLVDKHKLDRRGGEVGFNFTVERKIKKLYVTALQQRLLAAGSIALARIGERFELVPEQVASKIAERDADRVIFCTRADAEPLDAEEQDWYKDFEIPDDLMW